MPRRGCHAGHQGAARVDDTNPARKIRRPYVTLARKHDVWVRVVFFNDFEAARARNAKRSWSEGRIPDDTVARMQESLEPPTRAEGFDEVCSVELQRPRVGPCAAPR